MIRFILNEKEIETDLPPGMVLLDFIRYHLHQPGTKIGCREGDCGACTVLVGEIAADEMQYESMTSCLVPMGNVHGKHIVTIEGINFTGSLNPVQQAMEDAGATQCGFCTPGFVMSLAGFCLGNGTPTHENAIAAIDGNICRCTGYKSIERAASRVAGLMQERNGEEPVKFAAGRKILPAYFSGIKDRLRSISNNGVLADNSAPPVLFVGGGTDLYVQRHDEMSRANIRFISGEAGLNGISTENNNGVIGASATVSDLLNSPVIKKIFPDFHRYAKLVSSTPIRNMATIAGNLINASPIGDFTIFFLALDARITLTVPGDQGKPEMKPTLPLRELYKGYKQLNKKPEEMISQIRFEIPGKNWFFNFEKVSKRTHLDIASVNTAISLVAEENRIAGAGLSAGGVGPVPMYLEKTSGFLTGKTVTEDVIHKAIDVMKTEISPISDARGSKEYKTVLLGQLIKAHFMHMFPGLVLV